MCVFYSVARGSVTYQTLPSSCLSLSDGEHYVQPLTTAELQKQTGDDTAVAHPIRVLCDDGYMILDPSLDKNVEIYFSSFHSYHYAFAGPDLDDHVTWKEWFLPSRYDSSINVDNEDNYGIIGSRLTLSDDCQTCAAPENVDYPYETAFYMTGDLFGCEWSDGNSCAFDLDTLECQTCANAIVDASESLSNWGSCGHLQASATHPVRENHEVRSETFLCFALFYFIIVFYFVVALFAAVSCQTGFFRFPKTHKIKKIPDLM